MNIPMVRESTGSSACKDLSPSDVFINKANINQCHQYIIENSIFSKEEEIKLLLKAIQFIDLTTLAGDDTRVNVERLCERALKPLTKKLQEKLIEENFIDKIDSITTAAVCVYPARVSDCVSYLDKEKKSLNIACVATGFPSGQFGIESRLQEIRYAVKNGANEIDVVINRAAALEGDWKTVYEEIREMREACGQAHLKVILEVGELISLENVYIASMTAMRAGADFIKTSTGKVTVNATIPVGIIMTRAIWQYYEETGTKVGFKPAGGISKSVDALNWMKLIEIQLGKEWLSPQYFRIGASSLLNDIEKRLFNLGFGREPKKSELSFC